MATKRNAEALAAYSSTPVLVVDDHRDMVQLVRRSLRHLGLTLVDEAFSGQAALDQLQRRAYGLVVCDIGMQPMSGLELLEKVRADPRLQALPFVLLTGEKELGTVIAAKRAGVSGYIVKPFTIDALANHLAAALPPLAGRVAVRAEHSL